MQTPVITSNISPLKEVSGGAAFLADPLDTQSIRKGILKIISDDEFRQQIVKKGSENVRRFKLDFITGLYEQLYEEILKK